MVRMTNSLRRDYAALLGVVMIVIGTFVIGGFAYTYTHRPSKLLDAASHLLERRKFRLSFKSVFQIVLIQEQGAESTLRFWRFGGMSKTLAAFSIASYV